VRRPLTVFTFRKGEALLGAGLSDPRWFWRQEKGVPLTKYADDVEGEEEGGREEDEEWGAQEDEGVGERKIGEEERKRKGVEEKEEEEEWGVKDEDDGFVTSGEGTKQAWINRKTGEVHDPDTKLTRVEDITSDEVLDSDVF
jgi:hypothetical protein